MTRGGCPTRAQAKPQAMALPLREGSPAGSRQSSRYPNSPWPVPRARATNAPRRAAAYWASARRPSIARRAKTWAHAVRRSILTIMMIAVRLVRRPRRRRREDGPLRCALRVRRRPALGRGRKRRRTVCALLIDASTQSAREHRVVRCRPRDRCASLRMARECRLRGSCPHRRRHPLHSTLSPGHRCNGRAQKERVRVRRKTRASLRMSPRRVRFGSACLRQEMRGATCTRQANRERRMNGVRGTCWTRWSGMLDGRSTVSGLSYGFGSGVPAEKGEMWLSVWLRLELHRCRTMCGCHRGCSFCALCRVIPRLRHVLMIFLYVSSRTARCIT